MRKDGVDQVQRGAGPATAHQKSVCWCLLCTSAIEDLPGQMPRALFEECLDFGAGGVLGRKDGEDTNRGGRPQFVGADGWCPATWLVGGDAHPGVDDQRIVEVFILDR